MKNLKLNPKLQYKEPIGGYVSSPLAVQDVYIEELTLESDYIGKRFRAFSTALHHTLPDDEDEDDVESVYTVDGKKNCDEGKEKKDYNDEIMSLTGTIYSEYEDDFLSRPSVATNSSGWSFETDKADSSDDDDDDDDDDVDQEEINKQIVLDKQMHYKLLRAEFDEKIKTIPILEALLRKRHPKLPSWQKRYVVVKNFNFYYSRKPIRFSKDGQIDGELHGTCMKVRFNEPPTTTLHKPKKGAKNVVNCIPLYIIENVGRNGQDEFTLQALDQKTDLHRKYRFKCQSKLEREQWMSVLQKKRLILMAIMKLAMVSEN